MRDIARRRRPGPREGAGRVRLGLWWLLVLAPLAPIRAAPPADEPTPPLLKDSSAVVTVSVSPARATVVAGQEFGLQVRLRIDKKWHLYAHEDTTFYGIDLSLAEDSPLQDVRIVYPPGKKATFFGEPVRILAGRQTIDLFGRIPAELSAPACLLQLDLAVQACDDKCCLAPAFIPLRVELEVDPAGESSVD
jgi:hypothetical protein